MAPVTSFPHQLIFFGRADFFLITTLEHRNLLESWDWCKSGRVRESDATASPHSLCVADMADSLVGKGRLESRVV